MASRSMSRPAASSSSSGEREKKAEGKSSETDSPPPEDDNQLFPRRQGDTPANQERPPWLWRSEVRGQRGKWAGLDVWSSFT